MLLQEFLSVFGITIFTGFVVLVVSVLLPTWHFTESAYAAINLYSIMRKITADESSFQTPFKVLYGNSSKSFANADEAIIECEALIKQAFVYYNRLGWIPKIDFSYQIDKERLDKIYSELEMAKLKRQED